MKQESIHLNNTQMLCPFLDEFHLTKKCWKRLNPPNTEKELLGEWYGCIFAGKKTVNLFVGKNNLRFLTDDIEMGGYAAALEVNCLQQKFGIGDNVLKENTRGDIGNVHLRPHAEYLSGQREVGIPRIQKAARTF